MEVSTIVIIVVAVLVIALAFAGLFLTLVRQRVWREAAEREHNINYLQVVLLGVGGVIGFGSLIAALLTLTSAQRVETRRAEAELVQQYLESMESSITDNKLPEFEPIEPKIDDSGKARIKRQARAQTLAVLRSVEDPDRKRVVVRFLDESGLINTSEPIVDLSDAYIVGANLSYVGLGATDLSGALLTNVNFFDSSLIETNFDGASLDGADIRNTNLTGASLEGTWLTGADLRGADLTGADLTGADLTGADLRDAVGITNEELEHKAESLNGATMPDGSCPTAQRPTNLPTAPTPPGSRSCSS